jgi:hypothetical protein
MCSRGSCDESCTREGDTHDHQCAECGHWFECAAGWTRADVKGDGYLRDVRACDDTTRCGECREA